MTCITYFIVIFGGRFLMTNVAPFKLKAPFMIHNVLLTLVSGILLVLMVEQIFPIFYRHGLMAAICANETWTQPLELLYYLNYLVKYWELIDTIFLVLKKKKLGKFNFSLGRRWGELFVLMWLLWIYQVHKLC